jgi:hypothetical protein
MHSLSVLADIQLAAELHPDHESRTNIYRQFDELKKMIVMLPTKFRRCSYG